MIRNLLWKYYVLYVWFHTLTSKSSEGATRVVGDGCNQYGICSQLCTNTEEGHNCSCIDGFELEQDGWGCDLTDIYKRFLCATGCLSEALAETNNGSLPRGKPVFATSDARNKVIYWGDDSSGATTIFRKRLVMGSAAEVIANTEMNSIDGMAFDWITGNIYIVDGGFHRISVCRNDSKSCAVVVQDAGIRPRDVAIHPNLGIMFWIDWGNHSTSAILRSGMEGSHPLQIVSFQNSPPGGLTVDYGNDRIYWVEKASQYNDDQKDKIASARLDGSDQRIVLLTRKIFHYSVQVFGNRVYWGDGASKEIMSAGKFNGSAEAKESTRLEHGFLIFHVANQPVQISNPCEGGNCSHVCTIKTTSSFRCFCPEGMQLGADGVTCFEIEARPTSSLGTAERERHLASADTKHEDEMEFGSRSIVLTVGLFMVILVLLINYGSTRS